MAAWYPARCFRQRRLRIMLQLGFVGVLLFYIVYILASVMGWQGLRSIYNPDPIVHYAILTTGTKVKYVHFLLTLLKQQGLKDDNITIFLSPSEGYWADNFPRTMHPRVHVLPKPAALPATQGP